MTVAAKKRAMKKLESLAAERRALVASRHRRSHDEVQQEIKEILERAKARKEAIDEALASGDPERQAWARKTLRDLKGGRDAKAQREELEALLTKLKAQYALRSNVANETLGGGTPDNRETPSFGNLPGGGR